MKTDIIKVDVNSPEPELIRAAGGIIMRGGLVGFPTETVYGLAADAFNEHAVRRIFEVKGRPINNPLPVQVFSAEQVSELTADIPVAAERLMARFFPGPLTIVFRASSAVSEIITAETGKVGIRMPDHAVTLAFLRACGTPIVAPSANPSGAPAPSSAEEVLSYFDGTIDAVLDAGPSLIKIASTVVDITESEVEILRQGAIPRELIMRAI